MLSKSYTKYIQSLHHKKFRDAEDCFIAEGPKIVMELLTIGKFKCEQLAGNKDWINENEITIRKHYQGALQITEAHELEKISALSTPNLILGVFKKAKDQTPVLKSKIVIALDTIQDPGNLGTIIRIADWFGIEEIICSKDSVEVYNPKVVQSTMGSIGRVNVTYHNLEEILAKQNVISMYAAALQGKNIKDVGKIKEGIIIIGNESKGISDEIMGMATIKITIPKMGEAESLNAAVATGIILSHIV